MLLCVLNFFAIHQVLICFVNDYNITDIFILFYPLCFHRNRAIYYDFR